MVSKVKKQLKRFIKKLFFLKSKSRHSAYTIITYVMFLLVGFLLGLYIGHRGIPFVKKEVVWSIGIYEGQSPDSKFIPYHNVHNPVLTAKDITDREAESVADPFLIQENQTWYMFFEVVNKNGQGDIGLASSQDGLRWTYQQIVLDETFHLSYPYVFKWQNDDYMIPETYQADSVRLYKADKFPTHWVFVSPLLNPCDCVDPSIFRYNGKWWLFTAETDHTTLFLYYADELQGPWIEYPKSPVVEKNPEIARPGGRVIVLGDRILRYAQDDRPTYGDKVRAFEITQLTPTIYEEKPVDGNPIITAGDSNWNKKGMHHLDPHQINKDHWIASVDGLGNIFVFSLFDL